MTQGQGETMTQGLGGESVKRDKEKERGRRRQKESDGAESSDFLCIQLNDGGRERAGRGVCVCRSCSGNSLLGRKRRGRVRHVYMY